MSALPSAPLKQILLLRRYGEHTTMRTLSKRLTGSKPGTVSRPGGWWPRHRPAPTAPNLGRPHHQHSCAEAKTPAASAGGRGRGTADPCAHTPRSPRMGACTWWRRRRWCWWYSVLSLVSGFQASLTSTRTTARFGAAIVTHVTIKG